MANASFMWRGAVEPSDSGVSGNSQEMWRGAVERVLFSFTGSSLESTSEVGNPALTMNYDPVRRLFTLTGALDLTDLTGETN